MKDPNKLIVAQMMDDQIALIKKNPELGPTCILAIDTTEKYSYLVPCVNQLEDLLLLAEKLEESAQKLRFVANKTGASDKTKKKVH